MFQLYSNLVRWSMTNWNSLRDLVLRSRFEEEASSDSQRVRVKSMQDENLHPLDPSSKRGCLYDDNHDR